MGQKREGDLYIEIERSMHARVDLGNIAGPRIQPWGAPDYMAELSELAEAKGMSLSECAKRFGKVSVPTSEQGWHFHPALGYAKRK